LTIAKQRNGPTGAVEVWFDRRSMRFQTRATEDPDEQDPFA
jgi:replicative DNA helicase